jgi:hypothetical protein
LFFANEALAMRKTAVVVKTATRLIFEAFIVGFLIGKRCDLAGAICPATPSPTGDLKAVTVGNQQWTEKWGGNRPILTPTGSNAGAKRLRRLRIL